MAVVVMIGVVLAGCNLPASQSPAATATSAVPFPVATNNALVQDILRQTLTAAAANTTPLPTEAVSTQAVSNPAGSTVVATLSQFTPVVDSTSAALTAIVAPTTNATAYPTPTAGRPSTYTIHQGEFCYCLARRYNIDPATLINANPVCKSSALTVGTTITLPLSAASYPGTRALISHPTTYVVRYGDTIYSVGCHFGDVDPNTLAAANGLTSPFTLTPGQTIKIP
jgi:LysM repeat protein